jgi:hypothetical protein
VEELKSLLPSTPPPLKTSSTPPPLKIKTPQTAAEDKSKKKKLLYILIGAGAGAILITVLATLLIVKSCNSEKSNKGDEEFGNNDNTEQIDEGTMGTSEGDEGGKNGKVSDDAKLQDNKSKEQKEEAEKEAYRKNWRKYVYAKSDYQTGPFNSLINPTVTVTNSLPYFVNKVTVVVTYYLFNGEKAKTETLTYYNLNAHGSELKNTPPPSPGCSSIKSYITHIESSSLGLNSN